MSSQVNEKSSNKQNDFRNKPTKTFSTYSEIITHPSNLISIILESTSTKILFYNKLYCDVIKPCLVIFHAGKSPKIALRAKM
jgi:hypothetical protein